ncbi:MAG TPA: PIN domain-containing protein [Thermoanaerobaculia bacterium]
MILVDTGPFVALFDPRDREHARCSATLASLDQALISTVPVLTEAFHLLPTATRGAANLRTLIARGGISLWFMDGPGLRRALDLMEQYADHLMDLADASLVVAAESLRVRKIFTLDRDDFSTYRIRRGRALQQFEIIP